MCDARLENAFGGFKREIKNTAEGFLGGIFYIQQKAGEHCSPLHINDAFVRFCAVYKLF